jgi:hypothetical protein
MALMRKTRYMSKFTVTGTHFFYARCCLVITRKLKWLWWNYRWVWWSATSSGLQLRTVSCSISCCLDYFSSVVVIYAIVHPFAIDNYFVTAGIINEKNYYHFFPLFFAPFSAICELSSYLGPPQTFFLAPSFLGEARATCRLCAPPRMPGQGEQVETGVQWEWAVDIPQARVLFNVPFRTTGRNNDGRPWTHCKARESERYVATRAGNRVLFSHLIPVNWFIQNEINAIIIHFVWVWRTWTVLGKGFVLDGIYGAGRDFQHLPKTENFRWL